MDCHEAQELVLESLDAAVPAGTNPELVSHLAACSECRSFAEMQQALDLRLTASMPAPALPHAFRSELRRRIGRDPMRAWPEWLPDAVHFASCGAATLVCALALPYPGATTLAIGGAVTGATWLLRAFYQGSLEEVEELGR
jgi:predicted anti-sigma-YlaC factor YlaD